MALKSLSSRNIFDPRANSCFAAAHRARMILDDTSPREPVLRRLYHDIEKAIESALAATDTLLDDGKTEAETFIAVRGILNRTFSGNPDLENIAKETVSVASAERQSRPSPVA